jgi:hypothetical protein
MPASILWMTSPKELPGHSRDLFEGKYSNVDRIEAHSISCDILQDGLKKYFVYPAKGYGEV